MAFLLIHALAAALPVSDLLLKGFVIVLRSQIGACLLVEMELFLVGYFLAQGGRQCYPNWQIPSLTSLSPDHHRILEESAHSPAGCGDLMTMQDVNWILCLYGAAPCPYLFPGEDQPFC